MCRRHFFLAQRRSEYARSMLCRTWVGQAHTACRACHAYTPLLFLFSLSLFIFVCHRGRRVRDGLDDLFAFSSGFSDKIHVYFSSNVLSGMYVVSSRRFSSFIGMTGLHT
jgi:hypothetical protein